MLSLARRSLLPGLLVVTAACGGGPRPPAQPPPETASEIEPAAPGTATAQPAPAPEPVRELRTPVPEVVIEPTDPEPEAAPTLAEAALRERQRRNRAGTPIAVINDANLQDHAVGELTFMEEVEEPAGAAGSPGAVEEGPDEQYWRERVRGIRQSWADAAAEVPLLEERAAELRRRFYAADDAYYRDTRIKPAWDRTIDLIAQAQAVAEVRREELETALLEGRQAGALPGWLRDGIELEPEPLEAVPEGPEPGEPEIVEPAEGGGP